jgi:hypothetical protein
MHVNAGGAQVSTGGDERLARAASANARCQQFFLSYPTDALEQDLPRIPFNVAFR